jgi:ribosomal protein S18 acetylase RimI-like enzyme
VVGDHGARDPSRWVVDELRAEDHEAWSRLHRGYLEFYESTRPDEVTTIVWGWLTDPTHELECLVVRADADSEPVGIAHIRPFVRPLHGSVSGFLDDLYVAPEHRGTGAVDALLSGIQERARERGWPTVRWITRASNTRARSTYDRVAEQTDLVTYDLAVD